MNEFLIDCSFKQYSMAIKFDLLIQRYAIWILRYAAMRGIMVQRYAAHFRYFLSEFETEFENILGCSYVA
jgi:hypothetical protein